MTWWTAVLAFQWLASAALAQCPNYVDYSTQKHAPFSSGRYQLSSQRPASSCRTFNDTLVNKLVEKYGTVIKDPDLYRLFENAYPNTLDTAIKWKGTAAKSDEELTFIITGDINAMWLRDSANQMQSYLPLLKASNDSDSLASLYRGVINLQSRYVMKAPYCNSFQPPAESGIKPESGAGGMDAVKPSIDKSFVFECKYELDSLAAFLEVSTNYWAKTNDTAFFAKYNWPKAVEALLDTADAMMTPTYAPNGSVNSSPYTFTRMTNVGTETLNNGGIGNPVQAGIGLVRSAFRPSDDATIYQYFIPANMMFSRFLSTSSFIMAKINGQERLTARMRQMSTTIRTAISAHGIVHDPHWGTVYAYEVDGFGSRNMMDDANIPSLLSAPFFGYFNVTTDPVYVATRKMILSAGNPYYMRGPVINAVGGPHVGPGMAWPMASIVRILTSNDTEEMYSSLKEIVSSTDGLGLIHESINTFNQSDFTRQWFSWANGLFGQMILDVQKRKPELLQRSYQ